MNKEKIFLKIIFICILFAGYSCKKLIDVPSPQNQLTTDKVFADTTSAKSALFAVYVMLENQQYPAFDKYLSFYSDEGFSANDQTWDQSRILATDVSATADWTYLYSAIYQSNKILEQLNASSLPLAFTQQIKAEALFIRGYCYLYLVNLYGNVPLLTTSDVNVNRSTSQSDSATVYHQINADLTTARNDLSVGYPGGGRIRANRACASALLARLNLYQKNWSQAESIATEVIGSGNYTPLETVANAFKSTGKEAILQLATQNGFTTEAGTVIPSSATIAPSYYLTDAFYNSFATGDLRKTNWIGTSTITSGANSMTYHYPYKYKNRVANTTTPENLMVLRIGEQLLIRAEARAYQNKLNGAGSAAEDINLLRARAGLPNVQYTALADALQSIYDERRHEMFFENADRFMDLKRTGRLQSVMSAAKPTWQTTSAVLPIPSTDITTNSKLIQNAGY